MTTSAMMSPVEVSSNTLMAKKQPLGLLKVAF